MFDDGHSATAVVEEQIIFTASKVKGTTNNQISVLKRPAKRPGGNAAIHQAGQGLSGDLPAFGQAEGKSEVRDISMNG